MLSNKKLFQPQRNSMYEPVEVCFEALRQEALEEIDKDRIPYNVLGWGDQEATNPNPDYFSAMDYLVEVKEME